MVYGKASLNVYNLNEYVPFAYPKPFSRISEGCELDFQPPGTVGTYAVTREETFGPICQNQSPESYYTLCYLGKAGWYHIMSY